MGLPFHSTEFVDSTNRDRPHIPFLPSLEVRTVPYVSTRKQDQPEFESMYSNVHGSSFSGREWSEKSRTSTRLEWTYRDTTDSSLVNRFEGVDYVRMWRPWILWFLLLESRMVILKRMIGFVCGSEPKQEPRSQYSRYQRWDFCEWLLNPQPIPLYCPTVSEFLIISVSVKPPVARLREWLLLLRLRVSPRWTVSGISVILRLKSELDPDLSCLEKLIWSMVNDFFFMVDDLWNIDIMK